MTTPDDFTTEFIVDHTPDEVFAAINDVRAWFSETITGASAEVGDVFSFADEAITSGRIRVTDLVPGRRVAWHVEDAHDEWNDTTMTFEITRGEAGTTLRFTHHGLTPASACYRACSQGWTDCVNTSLRALITTGTGQPIPASVAP
ncbi:Activator of Hsp90 ATPase homolog 1-like protein [Amycolatopsis arida]|uniref:Activator of Hsp90 ATPase homolog 1-like protein n=1 Tax=Amycolatopsis arida TaxID=587909 RepID=A0A1I6AMT7_9PSEU|nr:SRPBCC domain-containing protein [Amycolatopsis arida]TDX87418.1 activator of Hsp90 ATPase-like protein [Amycolatopsis arida]SFQ70024.1 Activator of Hsp90 ATPase homolog 1-like protein [Amycolatopsis arida]